MKISRIEIENFRSIRKLKFDVPRYCALVGANNAGKSNILEALHRVLARDWVTVTNFSEEDIYSHDTSLDIRIAVTLDPPIQYTRFKAGPSISVPVLSFEYTHYKVGERKGQARLEQRCLKSDGGEIQVLAKAPRKGESHVYQPLLNIPAEVKDEVPVIYIGTNRSLRDQLPSARYSMLRHLLDDIDKDFRDPSNVVSVKTRSGEKEMPRATRFGELMSRALDVLRTPEFEKLERSIKRHALLQLGFDPDEDTDELDLFFSPFDSLDFYRSLELLVREGAFQVKATSLGEGVQNALVIAILQAFEERRKQGAIFLLEEPEMFLHPQKQRSLATTLREIARSNQVILTTHSSYFVSVPEYRNVLVVRKTAAGTEAVASNLQKGAVSEEKLRKELDPERNEFFFASRLLLVEGDSEKLAFPEYARRLDIDLDRAGCSIVEVGGKRNLLDFARVAMSFGIPTGVVYDEDSSDFSAKQASEEEQFNETLDALEQNDAHVWRLEPKYEAVLRETLGEQEYQRACGKYPTVSKAVRARLIAADADFDIPSTFEKILWWLASST